MKLIQADESSNLSGINSNHSAFLSGEPFAKTGRVFRQQLQFSAQQKTEARSTHGKRKADGDVSPAKGH